MVDDASINYKYLAESLLEAVPLPVFVIDRSLVVHYCNQPAIQVSRRADVPRITRLEQFIHDPALLQLIHESIQTNLPLKERYEPRDSDVAWTVSVGPLQHQSPLAAREISVSATDEQDSPTSSYFAIIIEDTTEARRVERMQRDFLANVSHELRTPLTSVRLLAETLEDTIDTHPDKAQEFVEKIETEVQYLSELVSDLLDLSRIESGQIIMTIEPIEAQRLVLEV